MEPKPEHIVIRTATVEDIPVVVDLWRELIDLHRDYDPYFTRSAEGHTYYAENLDKYITKVPNATVIVAELDGQLVGYCLAAFTRVQPVFEIYEYGEIIDFAVTTRLRRMGIGQRMFEQVRAWLAEHGIAHVELRVSVFNPMSTSFWTKMGFSASLTTMNKNIR